ncbi:MAG: AarF/ABC1/UbiB kinase family protein, partial [Pseudomonadota bacterium]
MAKTEDTTPGRAVPGGRFSRLAKFGGLGTSIASNMVVEGASRLAKGERPSLNDLLLTPNNARKVADQLSQLRGAAMKMGQLLSMDGGDFIPPELADILSRLRASAHSMPPKQLRRVLNDNWGRTWLTKFEKFEVTPMAAASIGQVHRAKTKDGRDLAVKIQYPGVRQSIDSDVDNVAMLIRLSQMVPDGVDVTPFLEEAKRQLHDEANYQREGEYLQKFRTHLADMPDFVLPEFYGDLTTENVLAMSYMPGRSIETLADAPQEERNRVMGLLMELLVKELFDFRLMQTDPNFANFHYDDKTGKIVLLDFGASRDVPEELSKGYQALLKAGIA